MVLNKLLFIYLVTSACVPIFNKFYKNKENPKQNPSSNFRPYLEEDSFGYELSLANNNYDTIVLANCEGTTCSFEVLRGDELDFSGTSGKQFHIVGCNIKEKYCNYLLENIELKNSEAEDAISRTSLPLEWYATYHDLLEKIHSSIIEVNKCSSSVSLSLTNDSVFDNFLDQNAQKTRDQFIKENIPNYYHFEKSRSNKPKISLEYSEDFPFKVSVGYFNEFKSDYNKIDSIKEFLLTKDYRKLYYGLFGAEWVFTHAFMEIHQNGGEKALLLNSFGRFDDLEELNSGKIKKTTEFYINKKDFTDFMRFYSRGKYSFLSRIKINKNEENMRRIRNEMIDFVMEKGGEGFFNKKVFGSQVHVATLIQDHYIERLKQLNATGDKDSFVKTISNDRIFKRDLNRWLAAGKMTAKNCPLQLSNFKKDELEELRRFFYKFQSVYDEYKSPLTFSNVRSSDEERKIIEARSQLDKLLMKFKYNADIDNFIAFNYHEVVSTKEIQFDDEELKKRLKKIFSLDNSLSNQDDLRKFVEYFDIYLEDTPHSNGLPYNKRWHPIFNNCSKSTGECASFFLDKKVTTFKPTSLVNKIDVLNKKYSHDLSTDLSRKYNLNISRAIKVLNMSNIFISGVSLFFISTEFFNSSNAIGLTSETTSKTCYKQKMKDYLMRVEKFENLIELQASFNFLSYYFGDL